MKHLNIETKVLIHKLNKEKEELKARALYWENEFIKLQQEYKTFAGFAIEAERRGCLLVS